jgi:biopolymer transport protein ExbD
MAIGKVPGADDDGGADAVFADINITPLTDIFLVLLIIFMVTSSVIVRQTSDSGGARAGIKVNLPKGGQSDLTPSQADLSVAILQDGRLVLSGDVVTEDEVKKAFATAKEKNPNTLVIVQADEGVAHGKVVEIMEDAKAAGLGQLAIGVREASH